MANYKVSDAGDPRKYYTQIPNMIDDMNLSPCAFRLYVHLKRVAGDDGICWQSTETLAKICKMSTGGVSNAKNELASNQLITVKVVPGEHGEFDHHEIKIEDIWLANSLTYSPGEQVPIHVVNRTVSLYEQDRSPGELKNNPIKNNPIKNNQFNPPTAETPEERRRKKTLEAMNRGLQKDADVKQKILDLFHLSPNWTWKGNKVFLEWVKERKPGELERFAEWWSKEDWRGKTGQPPTLAQIQELWPQAFIVVPVHESPLEKRIREKKEREAKYGR